jgi:crossover junction endodeoxyribonuclease RuvC
VIVLGLDPGIARTGFGVINTERESVFIACGCLTTSTGEQPALRLHTIGQDLTAIIEKYRPERAVVETVLFGANTKTAILTAETRGALLYVLREHGVDVVSLTPLQIKSRLTGYGAADKGQVGRVVQKRLHLDTIPKPDDAADGLAAALSLSETALTARVAASTLATV